MHFLFMNHHKRRGRGRRRSEVKFIMIPAIYSKRPVNSQTGQDSLYKAGVWSDHVLWYTHTHTHTHTHTLFLTHTHTHSHTLTHSLSHTHTHTHTHKHTHLLTHTHTHTHTLSFSHTHKHTHTHSHTHTQTHTHVCFCEKWGHPIGVMVFILYKLYVLLPYTYPIPKLSPHRRLCISTFPKKTSLCMIYKRFEKWGHGSMSWKVTFTL